MSDGGGSLRLRTVGDAAWWVFIVASLIAGGVTWLAGERYVPFVPPSMGADEVAYSGSYSRLDGVMMTKAYVADETTNWWLEPAFYSVAAFVVVVAAALWEACTQRDVIAAAATVTVPFAALAVLGLATPGVIVDDDLSPIATLALVVVAVGLRGWWKRTVSPTSGGAPDA